MRWKDCKKYQCCREISIKMRNIKVSPAAATHDHGLLQELWHAFSVFGAFQWSILVVIAVAKG
jgi:hypothetical protein